MTCGWQEHLRNLQKQIHEDNIQNGWWGSDEEPILAEVLFNIIGEGFEAWQEYRDNRDLDEVYYSIDSNGNEKPEGIPIEIADIIIRALDAAEAWEIDLSEAINEKLAYNRTRGYRHGGKRN